MKTKCLATVLGTAALFCSCVNDMKHPTAVFKPSNDFTFSTVSEDVNLDLLYANTGVNAPVAFEVFDTCPVSIGDGDQNYSREEGILPIYSGYTDSDGRFNEEITLPSYVKKVYVYAPAFYARTLIEAEVKDGKIEVRDTPAAATKASIAQTAATKEPHYSYMAEDCQKERGSKYNDGKNNPWKVWLGDYDKYNQGRIDYICTDPSLVPAEPGKLYLAFHEALKLENGKCPVNMRTSTDMFLSEDGEVAVTFLGQNTCSNNSIGYYYYEAGQQPANLSEANVIMLFPNTQDGLWEQSYPGTWDATPYKGLDRLTTVKLVYYPNIATGSKEGATSVFPAGMRIGLVMANNAWSDRLKFSSFNVDFKNRAATTPGLSVYEKAPKKDEDSPRTSIFRVDEEVFLSFEDHDNDFNYTDCVLALNSNPENILQGMPVLSRADIGEEVTDELAGVYAFEDLWPWKGDYDLNDVVVTNKHQTITSDGKVVGEAFLLKVFMNGAANTNGIAVSLINSGKLNNKFTSQGTISCFMRANGEDEFKPVELEYEPVGGPNKREYPVYILTDDVKSIVGSEFRIIFTYHNATAKSIISARPFVFRNNENGIRREIHIVNDIPTPKMDFTMLGKGHDASIPAEGRYFVCEGNYPFAIYLSGASEEDILPILKHSNEMVSIDKVFPEYTEWVSSKGKKNQDWYKHPAR